MCIHMSREANVVGEENMHTLQLGCLFHKCKPRKLVQIPMRCLVKHMLLCVQCDQSQLNTLMLPIIDLICLSNGCLLFLALVLSISNMT